MGRRRHSKRLSGRNKALDPKTKPALADEEVLAAVDELVPEYRKDRSTRINVKSTRIKLADMRNMNVSVKRLTRIVAAAAEAAEASKAKASDPATDNPGSGGGGAAGEGESAERGTTPPPTDDYVVPEAALTRRSTATGFPSLKTAAMSKKEQEAYIASRYPHMSPNSRKTKAREMSKRAEDYRRRHHNANDPIELAKKKIEAASYSYGRDWAKMFRTIDKDGSGQLDLEEFRKLLRTRARIPVSQLTDDHIRSLFEAVDDDNTGSISADEFSEFMNLKFDFDAEPFTPSSSRSPRSRSTSKHSRSPRSRSTSKHSPAPRAATSSATTTPPDALSSKEPTPRGDSGNNEDVAAQSGVSDSTKQTLGIEAPAGEKNHGAYTTMVYTEEQQKRLGVDELGAKVEPTEHSAPSSRRGLGPAWTRGEIEKPAGSKNRGSYTVLVYTEEQQQRLGVNERGDKVEQPRSGEQSGVTQAKQTIGPAWTRGEIEKPAGEKNHGSHTTLVYTEEQQQRLGVDEEGNKVEQPNSDGSAKQVIGPAWTRGEIEKPAGEKNHGSYTTLVYTEEQQQRLGVDEEGNKLDESAGDASAKQTVGPAWTRGEIEKPAGEKDHGSYTSLVYTEEQQQRLGVDEQGNKVGQSSTDGAAKQTLGPAWTRGEIEKPAGEKDHGSHKTLVYTEEQQGRLGVDEEGNEVTQQAQSDNARQTLGPAHTRGELEPPAGEKDNGSFTIAVYTEEQQRRLGIDEHGQPLEQQASTSGKPDSTDTATATGRDANGQGQHAATPAVDPTNPDNFVSGNFDSGADAAPPPRRRAPKKVDTGCKCVIS